MLRLRSYINEHVIRHLAFARMEQAKFYREKKAARTWFTVCSKTNNAFSCKTQKMQNTFDWRVARQPVQCLRRQISSAKWNETYRWNLGRISKLPPWFPHLMCTGAKDFQCAVKDWQRLRLMSFFPASSKLIEWQARQRDFWPPTFWNDFYLNLHPLAWWRHIQRKTRYFTFPTYRSIDFSVDSFNFRGFTSNIHSTQKALLQYWYSLLCKHIAKIPSFEARKPWWTCVNHPRFQHPFNCILKRLQQGDSKMGHLAAVARASALLNVCCSNLSG